MKSQENMKLEKLKNTRKQKGLSRQQLSELSGINATTIQALEIGKNDAFNVKLSTLVALAKALNVKIIDLLPNELHKIIR